MKNQDKDVTKQKFSQETLTNPPANHNPLIGMQHFDALINVYDSLSTLQELAVSPPNGELVLSPASSTGLYFLFCCIKDALRFEIDYRSVVEKTRDS